MARKIYNAFCVVPFLSVFVLIRTMSAQIDGGQDPAKLSALSQKAKIYFQDLENVRYRVETKATTDDGEKEFSWTYNYVGNGTQFLIKKQYQLEKPLGRLVEESYARDLKYNQCLVDGQLALSVLPKEGNGQKPASMLAAITATKNYGALLLPWRFMSQTLGFDLNNTFEWSDKIGKGDVFASLLSVHETTWNAKPAIEVIMKEQEGIFKNSKMNFAMIFAQEIPFPVQWKFTDNKGDGLLYSVKEIASTTVHGHNILYPKVAEERVVAGSSDKESNPYSLNRIVITKFEVGTADPDEFTIDPATAQQVLDLDANAIIDVPK